jgi:hypothetical protein
MTMNEAARGRDVEVICMSVSFKVVELLEFPQGIK